MHLFHYFRSENGGNKMNLGLLLNDLKDVLVAISCTTLFLLISHSFGHLLIQADHNYNDDDIFGNDPTAYNANITGHPNYYRGDFWDYKFEKTLNGAFLILLISIMIGILLVIIADVKERYE